jgi:hypothetical protein
MRFKDLLLVPIALAFGSGCLASAPQKTGQQAWDYYCLEGAERTPEAMKKAGDAGWELAAAASTGAQSTWCFKRPRYLN